MYEKIQAFFVIVLVLMTGEFSRQKKKEALTGMHRWRCDGGKSSIDLVLRKAK